MRAALGLALAASLLGAGPGLGVRARGTELPEETPGCFYYPWTAPTNGQAGSFVYEDATVQAPYPGFDAPHPTLVESAAGCQQLCEKERHYCHVFTYYPSTQHCWLQTRHATLVQSHEVMDAIAGPRTCPEEPEFCVATPNASSFPGNSSAAPDAAWPMGSQPRKSACWPRDAEGNLSPCKPTTVLLELAHCTYLLDPKPLPPQTTCKEVCEGNPSCASWNQADEDAPCYNGIGLQCSIFNGVNGLEKGGERLLRGTVRTLLDLTGQKFTPPPVVVLGVEKPTWVNVFSLDSYTYPQDAVPRCRELCASYLGCEFWQLHNETGCWADVTMPTSDIVYPLTSDLLTPDPQILAGEYLQHLCPPTPTPKPTNGTKPDAAADVDCGAQNKGSFSLLDWLFHRRCSRCAKEGGSGSSCLHRSAIGQMFVLVAGLVSATSVVAFVCCLVCRQERWKRKTLSRTRSVDDEDEEEEAGEVELEMPEQAAAEAAPLLPAPSLPAPSLPALSLPAPVLYPSYSNGMQPQTQVVAHPAAYPAAYPAAPVQAWPPVVSGPLRYR